WRDHCRTYLEKEAGSDPKRQLMTLIDLYLEVLTESEFRGCFFINAMTQFPNPLDPIHKAAVGAKEAVELMGRDLALRAGAKDPMCLSHELSLLFEGAFALRH